MKIAINHLTRMRAGYICVAGVDLESGQHVRPVLSGAKQLSTTLLARNAGPFEMGVIVDLGTVTPVGQKPEVEDHLFDPSQCTALRVVGPRSFWKLLGEHAKPTLREIFGPDLMKRGASSCAVDVGKGDASLGCFGPEARPQLYINSDQKIRIAVKDPEFDLDLGVTDIRLYRDDHVSADEKVVKQIVKRIKAGETAILSVGLTRPFGGSQFYQPVHWLQVNNIHLEGDPTWQLG